MIHSCYGYPFPRVQCACLRTCRDVHPEIAVCMFEDLQRFQPGDCSVSLSFTCRAAHLTCTMSCKYSSALVCDAALERKYSVWIEGSILFFPRWDFATDEASARRRVGGARRRAETRQRVGSGHWHVPRRARSELDGQNLFARTAVPHCETLSNRNQRAKTRSTGSATRGAHPLRPRNGWQSDRGTTNRCGGGASSDGNWTTNHSASPCRRRGSSEGGTSRRTSRSSSSTRARKSPNRERSASTFHEELRMVTDCTRWKGAVSA